MAKNIFQNQMGEEGENGRVKMIPRALFGSPNPAENDQLMTKVYSGKIMTFQRRWNFNLDESENLSQRHLVASAVPEEKFQWEKSSPPENVIESPLLFARYETSLTTNQMEVVEECPTESHLSISPKLSSPPTPATSPIIQNKTKPKFLFPPVLRQRTISEYMKIKKTNRAKKI